MQKFMCILQFLLCFILNLRAISEYKPLGTCIWRGDSLHGFLHYKFGELIFEGAYFRNLTVFQKTSSVMMIQSRRKRTQCI